MKKKQLIPSILLLIISFLLLIFASWSRLEHWNVNYFYLSAALAIILFLTGIYFVFRMAKK